MTVNGDETESVSSVFSVLPENPVTNFLSGINSRMSEVLGEFMIETPLTSFFIQNPLIILGIFFGVMVSISLFLNFIQDAWKIPIAVGVDVLGLMALQSGFGILTIIAIASGFLFFFLLFRDLEKLKYVFGSACAIKPLLPFGIVNIFPLNTVLAFIAALLTR